MWGKHPVGPFINDDKGKVVGVLAVPELHGRSSESVDAVHGREEVSDYSAVGIHVFAGAMSAGVQRVMPVEMQLEVHGLGADTATDVFGMPLHVGPYEDWPDVRATLAFGNPRCTAFSSLTGGLSKESHGAFAKQTIDARQFCEYSAGRFDYCVWESVQQAYSTGKAFLDAMTREYYAPKGYRICHVLMNYAAFGSPQPRKRYFYVAYPQDAIFNVAPPPIPSQYHATLWDAIGKWKDDEGTPWHPSQGNCPPNGYLMPSEDEAAILPKLPSGWSLNALAAYHYDALTPNQQRIWNRRTSNKPFSLHCVRRLAWCTWAPTVHSGCKKWIHPTRNRPLTIREVCAIAGWPEDKIPVGPDPYEQVAKGVCPDAGEWIAEQVIRSINGEWPDDWESTYDSKECEWQGELTRSKVEKLFNLTQYFGQQYDIERFPLDIQFSHRMFNLRGDGSLERSWKEVTKRYWEVGGGSLQKS